MYGKIVTSKEFFQITDLETVKASLGGKYGRVIVELYEKDGKDFFRILVAPSNDNELAYEVKYTDCIVICEGLLDYVTLSRTINDLKTQSSK